MTLRSRFASALFCLAAAGSLSACASHEQAEALLTELRGQNYRGTFARAPGWTTPRQRATNPHHGQFIDIYVNAVAQAAVMGGARPATWPSGTIVVKDGWGDAAGTDAVQIAIMKKTPAGEWYWAEYAGDGKPLESGERHGECLECHTATRDYVIAF